MNNQKNPGDETLSKDATWWFCIAILLASLPYAFLTFMSTYGLMYGPKRVFFICLMTFLAVTNGLVAIALNFRSGEGYINNQKNPGDETLSKAATWWFYIAIFLALIPYAFLTFMSTYGLMYRPKRVFFTQLMVFLAGANGLAAIALTLRRKLYGTYWSVVPILLLLLYAVGTDRGAFRQDDLIMALLLGTPVALLLSQIPRLRKLKTLGPGWGLGTMAYTSQTPFRAAAWWFRIVLTFSILTYLGLGLCFCSLVINNPPSAKFSLYMVGIASLSGFFTVVLTLRKEIFGMFWSLTPCFFLGLATINVGFGRTLRSFTSWMLPICILVALLLLSQIPYLKKLNKIYGKGFQKTHFANGASFSDEALSTLYKVWFTFRMSVTEIYLPCLTFALLMGTILSHGVRGAIGNFLAVAVFFGATIFAFIMIKARKKRYVACRDKLGLTENDIYQALIHKKRGTVAVDSPADQTE